MPVTIARFTGRFTTPFFSGQPTSELVPDAFPVSINGHVYMLDLDHESVGVAQGWFREESLPLLRQQSDQSELPGEQSISPQQFWRRSQESWHGGAGQSYLDRAETSDFRFNTSKGVDPWTKWQLGLLNDTARTETLAVEANPPSLVSTGDDAYATAGGATLRRSADGTTWATVTGTPAANCSALATSGGTIWSAWGASGIYQTTAGTATATSYVTGTVERIAFVKGRLLASNGAALYNPTASGALPAALFTHPAASWTWTAFAAGQGFIYAGGFANGYSEVYRITVQPDGTALTVPVSAAQLPTGEKVRSLLGYLGFVVIGTDKGVRFAVADSDGDLTLGALIPTTSPVYALEAQDRFVWFGWSNYDASSTGSGRMDLSVVTPSLAPAYASDLMAAAQGDVRAVATVDGKRIFAVTANGIYLEQTGDPVASGTLSTGQITYGISDKKLALFVDLKHEPLPTGTSISVALSTDQGTSTSIGSSSVTGSSSPSPTISANQKRGETFELTLTLTSSGANAAKLNRWTLRSLPTPDGAIEWTLPLLFRDTLLVHGCREWDFDCESERNFLRGLYEASDAASLQVGNESYSAVVTDFMFLPEKESTHVGAWQGACIVRLREVV